MGDAEFLDCCDFVGLGDAVLILVLPGRETDEFVVGEDAVAVVVECVEGSVSVGEEEPPGGVAEELASGGDGFCVVGIPDEQGSVGFEPGPGFGCAVAVEVEGDGEGGLEEVGDVGVGGEGEDDGGDAPEGVTFAQTIEVFPYFLDAPFIFLTSFSIGRCKIYICISGLVTHESPESRNGIEDVFLFDRL